MLLLQTFTFDMQYFLVMSKEKASRLLLISQLLSFFLYQFLRSFKLYVRWIHWYISNTYYVFPWISFLWYAS